MKHRWRPVSAGLGLFLLVVAACEDRPKPQAGPATTATASAVAPSATPSSTAMLGATASAVQPAAGEALNKIKAERGPGLAHKEARPEVIALATAALACRWLESDEPGFDPECPGWKAWRDSEIVKSDDGLYTLFYLLQDERKEVRWLAAKGLDKSDAGWHLTPHEATRLVAAARLEREIGHTLGWTMAKIAFQDTGLGPAMKELLRGAGDPPLRTGILTTSLYHNNDDADLFALYVKLARSDPDRAVRRFASGGLVNAGSQRRDAVCKVWVELAASDDVTVASEAALRCSDWSEDCSAQWDALLTTIGKRAEAGKVGALATSQALSRLLDKAKPGQKKRALAILRAIVDNEKNDDMARTEAQRILPAGRVSPASSAP
jgi:hypothetical protein